MSKEPSEAIFTIFSGDPFLSHDLWNKIMANYYRCEIWCRINRRIGECIPGSSDLWQNDGLLQISHSVVTIYSVSQHLWSIKRTWLRKRNLNHTHSAFLYFMLEFVLDRWSPSYASMTLSVIEGIWYDISRNPTWSISSMKVSMTRDITHKLHVNNHATTFNRQLVSQAATVMLCVALLV